MIATREKFRILLCGQKQFMDRVRKVIIRTDEIHLQFASTPAFMLGRAMFNPPSLIMIEDGIEHSLLEDVLGRELGATREGRVERGHHGLLDLGPAEALRGRGEGVEVEALGIAMAAREVDGEHRGGQQVLVDAHRLYTDATQFMRLSISGPFDPAKAAAGVKRRIAAASGFPDFEAFAAALGDARRQVRAAFEAIVG